MNGKIVFLGHTNAGKTSIINKYLKGNCLDTTPTISAGFFMTTERFGHSEMKIGIWDTAGSEKYKSIAPMYFRDADVGIIVVDSCTQTSDVNAEFWIHEILEKGKRGVSIIIAMNKIEVAETSTERISERAEKLVKKYGGQYTLTSAKTGEGISHLFQSAYEIIKKNIEEENKALQEEQLKERKEKESKNCC